VMISQMHRKTKWLIWHQKSY